MLLKTFYVFLSINYLRLPPPKQNKVFPLTKKFVAYMSCQMMFNFKTYIHFLLFATL